jgi:hypothetical protein
MLNENFVTIGRKLTKLRPIEFFVVEMSNEKSRTWKIIDPSRPTENVVPIGRKLAKLQPIEYFLFTVKIESPCISFLQHICSTVQYCMT